MKEKIPGFDREYVVQGFTNHKQAQPGIRYLLRDDSNTQPGYR